MDETTIPDERLELLFTCCHPALALDAQVALTLRTLGGLSTEEIARAFLKEGAGDLLGGEAAERPQRKRDLGVERECGVTAGEEELEPFVRDRRLVHLVLHGFRH